MEVRIRPMEEGHLDEVLEIESRSFATPWSRESFAFEVEQNPMSRYFVALGEDGVLGYAGIWCVIDEAHVTNICVDAKYRGEKIGKKLFQAIVNQAKDLGMEAMTLEVRKTNIVAKSLYESFGFREIGIRPKYYQDNQEDAIIMLREFKDVRQC